MGCMHSSLLGISYQWCLCWFFIGVFFQILWDLNILMLFLWKLSQSSIVVCLFYVFFNLLFIFSNLFCCMKVLCNSFSSSLLLFSAAVTLLVRSSRESFICLSSFSILWFLFKVFSFLLLNHLESYCPFHSFFEFFKYSPHFLSIVLNREAI